jgi:hypothetical protein
MARRFHHPQRWKGPEAFEFSEARLAGEKYSGQARLPLMEAFDRSTRASLWPMRLLKALRQLVIIMLIPRCENRFGVFYFELPFWGSTLIEYTYIAPYG